MKAARRTLLAVHAHPDDESSSTGGTLLHYGAAGVRTVVVTCTGGEVGEISHPDFATPETLGPIRAGELAAALEILGVSRAIQLGYRDSGMIGTPDNDHPDAFWQADLEEAAGRLVAIIREERPAVMLTYDENGGYGHPDHIRTNQVTLAAVAAAAEASRYPAAGPAWSVAKVYYTAFPRSTIQRLMAAFREAGIESPLGGAEGDTEPPPFGTPDELVTTEIDITPFLDRKRAALLAHRTQITPESPWMRLPVERLGAIWSTECFRLVQGPQPTAGRETDLFAGI